MPLPDFVEHGDLPIGVHAASLAEVLQRFGSTTGDRGRCGRILAHVYRLAQRTGHLQRLIVFGSFVTTKPNPNDVDIVLIMDDQFQVEQCSPEARAIFDHAVAQARYGASVFWIRPGLLMGDTLDCFVAHWQQKRDGAKRGIVEVLP